MSTIIPSNTTKSVEGSLSNNEDASSQTPYVLENSLVNRENLVVQTVKIDNLTRKIGIPIGNHSDEFIKLKKGMIVANVTKLDIINVQSIKCGSADVDDVSVPQLFSNRSDLTAKEKESLVTMINKYQIELNECGDKPKVPHEHEIKVFDKRPCVFFIIY